MASATELNGRKETVTLRKRVLLDGSIQFILGYPTQ